MWYFVLLAKNLPNSFKMHGIHNSNMYYNENQNVYLIMYPHQEYMQVHQPHSPHHMDSTWRQGKGEPNKLQCQFVKRVTLFSIINWSFINKNSNHLLYLNDIIGQIQYFVNDLTSSENVIEQGFNK